MYKRAAQRSLRMSQKFCEDDALKQSKKYNRALYPSVTQIKKYDSHGSTSNKR